MINLGKHQYWQRDFYSYNLLHFTNEVIRLESDVIQFPAAFDALHWNDPENPAGNDVVLALTMTLYVCVV